MKLTETQIKNIILEAQTAAANATAEYLGTLGGDTYPCGFAWVRIKPARGAFVKVLKDINLGRTDEYEGGFVVYNPSGNYCQNMDAKMAGARAFANALKLHGVNAVPEQRMD